MNISLTSNQTAYIQEKVESGLYANANEVIKAALELLRERDMKVDSLKLELGWALEQLENSEYSTKSISDIAFDVLDQSQQS